MSKVSRLTVILDQSSRLSPDLESDKSYERLLSLSCRLLYPLIPVISHTPSVLTEKFEQLPISFPSGSIPIRKLLRPVGASQKNFNDLTCLAAASLTSFSEGAETKSHAQYTVSASQNQSSKFSLSGLYNRLIQF